MTIYTVYQCSICRRIKDIPQDNIHAAPNECTITKGCLGYLFPLGQTTVLTPTPPVAGLTDWYPRGEQPTATPVSPPEQLVNLSTSANGALTLALYVPNTTIPGPNNPWGASPPINVTVAFLEQVTQDISYSEYIYTAGSGQTIIQGKDQNGFNLRFAVSDVTNGLVFVLVNGVAAFPSSTATPTGWWTTLPNQITFWNPLPTGAIVTVFVYSQPPQTTSALQFELNQNINLADLGAWDNIRWAQEYNPATGQIKPNNWWLYSCGSVAELGTSARLKLTGVYTNPNLTQPVLPYASSPSDFSGIRFLLASSPYDDTDRYLNFYIDGNTIANDYALVTVTSGFTQLYADTVALLELYPPLQLIESNDLLTSYISADTYPVGDSAVSGTTRLAGTKILGPL